MSSDNHTVSGTEPSTTSEKQRLLSLCGSMEQLAGVRPIQYQDGRAAGLRGALVWNGPLETMLMLDKCLDPAWLRYKGMNLGILTKPGLQGRNPYDTAGEEAVRSIMGGAMFTCGLGNIHGHRQVDGTEHPTHGRIRTTPAEKTGMDAWFDGDSYRVRVTGEMREARLFGENLVLRRTVECIYGERPKQQPGQSSTSHKNSQAPRYPAMNAISTARPICQLIFHDEIENQAFEPQPLCFLYHCNAGYPLLAPGTRLILPDRTCTPRDADARQGMDTRNLMGEPQAGAPEQVFQHTMAADTQGWTFGAFVNDALGLALAIRWNINQIPLLTQWKSSASGDYAMALEPANCGFGGRAQASRILQPLETHVNEIRFCIYEGAQEIAALEAEERQLRNPCPSQIPPILFRQKVIN